MGWILAGALITVAVALIVMLGLAMKSELLDDDYEETYPGPSAEPKKMDLKMNMGAPLGPIKNERWGEVAVKRGTKCPECEYLGYCNLWPQSEKGYLMSCPQCDHIWVDEIDEV